MILLASCAAAQVTLSNFKVEEGPSSNCVKVAVTVSGLAPSSTTWSQQNGLTDSLGNALVDQTVSEDGVYRSWMCAGEPEAKMYVKLVFGAAETTCAAACTGECDSSEDSLFADGSGLFCDDTDEPPYVVMAARPADPSPNPPVHAVVDPYAVIAGGTPHEATCATWKTVFDSVKTTAGVQLVNIDPTTGPCSVGLEDLTGATTRVVIQPDMDASLFASPFTRVDPDDPNLLEFRASDPRLLTGINDTFAGWIDGASNVAFRNIKLAAGATPYAPTQISVTAVNAGTRQLTLSGGCPSGLIGYHEVWLNMPNMEAYPVVAQVSNCASGVLTLSAGVTFTGSDATGATVTWGEAIPVSGATTGANTRLTVPNHGLPTGNYVGQGYLAVYVKGPLGAEINGNHAFTVIDANTLEFPGLASSAAYEASDYDYVYLSSAPRNTYVRGTGTSGLWLLQCVVGDPWWGQFGQITTISATDSDGMIVRDSFLWAAHPNCVLNPATNLCAGAGIPTYHQAYASQLLRFEGATDLQFVNNAGIGCAGICLNAQDVREGPSDITIQGNELYVSDRVFVDATDGYFPFSLKRWAYKRHLIEWKAWGQRIAITGNLFDGEAADLAQPQGFGIWFNGGNSYEGVEGPTVTRLRDLRISHNVIRRVATCFAIGDSLAAVRDRYNKSFPSRIEIEGNICDSDYTKQRESPGSPSSTSKPNSVTGGGFLQLDTGGELFLIHHNSWFSNRSRSPEILWWFRHWLPGLQVWRNVLSYHKSSEGVGLEGISAHTPGPSPYVSTNYLTRFASMTAGESNSAFFENLLIPGVEQGRLVGTYKNDPDTANTVTQAECESDWAALFAAYSGNSCVAGATYMDRHNAAFGAGSYLTKSPYTGYGPDATELMDALGVIRDVSVRKATGVVNGFCTTPGCVEFTWTAPSTDACVVRLTDDDWASVSSLTATAGAAAQSVQFTGLTAGVEYQARIECRGSRPQRWRQVL